jgi:ElaB/YqjD/DUF883 family membrane-anchored ribosome-binding protein
METAEGLTPAPSAAGTTLTRTVDQASTGAHPVIDTVSDAARPLVDRLATAAHQTVDKIAGAAGQMADSLGVNGEQLQQAQARAFEVGRAYVRDHPVASVGIAIAAGIVLSRLLSSR